ncbi:hypothetical protein TeGR_g322 [Tetraparma gracilis]|uniref:Transmembrane protein n=1 Tax=Tetraparma gracilis TaxID=2962635 RepID=A0ABQ6N6R2_9STRA|nr:hypothetical protein TeGR_g322 [Tetraparma gracilis]
MASLYSDEILFFHLADGENDGQLGKDDAVHAVPAIFGDLNDESMVECLSKSHRADQDYDGNWIKDVALDIDDLQYLMIKPGFLPPLSSAAPVVTTFTADESFAVPLTLRDSTGTDITVPLVDGEVLGFAAVARKHEEESKYNHVAEHTITGSIEFDTKAPAHSSITAHFVNIPWADNYEVEVTYSFSLSGDLICAPGFTPVDSSCERCGNGFVKPETSSAPCSACVSFVAGSVDTDPVLTPDSAASCICATGFVLSESACKPYLQIVSMLEVSLDIKFPSIMNKATRVGSASNVNFMGLAPVGCVGLRLNQDEKMLGFTAVLLALGAAAALLRKNGLVLQAYLVVISFLLPTTTSMIFSTFPCLELDTGERWLLADKSIDCDGGSHVVMVAYAWVMVILFCVGVPGGCFLLLWQAQSKIKAPEEVRKKDKSLDSIRSLFDNYKPDCWYWEPVEMTRRIFMTGFLVVLARGSYAQIVFCVLVTMVALSLLTTRLPFHKGGNNAVAQAMLWQTAVTLLLCVLVKSEAELGGEGELGVDAVDVMMILAQVSRDSPPPCNQH